MYFLDLYVFHALNAAPETPHSVVTVAKAASLGLPWVAGLVLLGCWVLGGLPLRKKVVVWGLAMFAAWGAARVLKYGC